MRSLGSFFVEGSVDLFDLVIGPRPFDASRAETATVGLPMGEGIALFEVGITMANLDIPLDIRPAFRQRSYVVDGRLVCAVRIPAGRFFHQAPRIIPNLGFISVALIPKINDTMVRHFEYLLSL